MDKAKPLKGIYILIIQINKNIRPKIGALGEVTFPAGLYAYVGSAQNNLELRVKRHLGKEKRLFWHIDYLLNNEAAKIIGIYCRQGGKTEECHIASYLRRMPSQLPVSDAQTAAATATFSALKASNFLENTCTR
jgi:Uri superfamily endonuclease